MSKAEVISRLEGLLARVRARASDPRRATHNGAAASAVDIVPPAPAPPPVRGPSPSAEVAERPTVSPLEVPPPRAPLVSEIVVSEVTELAIEDAPPEVVAALAAESVATSEKAESRERLIVAAPAADAPLELDEPLAAPPSPAEAKVPPPPPSEVEVLVDEPVEEAPVSSRRAVVAEPPERLAELAFGSEEQAPRHTPPPASGRLPAVPAEESESDITGVRETSAIPLTPPSAPLKAELRAEKTLPHVAASDAVARVVGEAQAFTPATFLALLDASLSL